LSQPPDPPADPRDRFSDRVADYVRYRPRYPAALLRLLEAEGVLWPASVVADLGSGTGISSQLLLDAGHTVYGVEPNAAMRRAAEELLAGYPAFHSVEGSAEATTLVAGSVDLVFAAQAYHWFDVEACRREWGRILRVPAVESGGSGGWVALVWNSRRTDTTPFLRAYEAVLHEYGTDYGAVNHQDLDYDALRSLFHPESYRRLALDNHQDLDRDGFFGRVFSSSYTPAPDHPGRPAMEAALDRLLEAHAEGGQVRLEYEVEIHLGRLQGNP
jgi:SAM-dependent methyltransferase